ncbi:MAG: hypothetical protein KatS3mg076_1541 [Candidatus Binatia bacterium]|nr:MAG: hypothetical protein KatS3mg076_1541 [Candidatus Binatia bacterium]
MPSFSCAAPTGAFGTSHFSSCRSPSSSSSTWRARPPARGTFRRSRLWKQGLWLLLGFSLVAAPWLFYFWRELGTAPFLRAIFFVGTNFESFYYLAYPPLGRWELALFAGAALIVAAGFLARRFPPPRWLAPAALVVAAAGGAAVWFFSPPPMVEGFQASVVMRMRHLAFGLVLLVAWAGLLAYLFRELGPRAEEEATSQGKLLVALLSGLLMHMRLYPRTDFMHLVPAAPGLFVVAAWLLFRLATLWGDALAGSPGGRRLVRVLVAAPLYVLVFVWVAPALGRIEYLARAYLGRDGEAVVRLGSERASLVVEPAAGRLFRDLSRTVGYLRERSGPEDYVFTFPALDLLLFLSGRQNPTRHGYFFPGWPGHDVEAEVIDDLETRPPRYVVALHDHPMYFLGAPLYYFQLRRYVRERYELERRIGTFDILRPRGSSEDLPVVQAPETLLADTASWRRELRRLRGATRRRLDYALGRIAAGEEPLEVLGGLDAEAQRLFARMVRKSRSRGGAEVLARALAALPLEPRVRELFVRVVVEVGDVTALFPLVDSFRSNDALERMAVAGIFFGILSRTGMEEYWYVPDSQDEVEAIAERMQPERLAVWMENPWENYAVRWLAVFLAGYRQEEFLVVPLVGLLGNSGMFSPLRVEAARSLARHGIGGEIAGPLGRLLAEDRFLVPELLLDLYSRAPEEVRPVVERRMADPDTQVRSLAFWIAVATRDPAFREAFENAAFDPFPEVRMASVWGLGQLGFPESVRPFLEDPDDRVRAFARRAVEGASKALAARWSGSPAEDASGPGAPRVRRVGVSGTPGENGSG